MASQFHTSNIKLTSKPIVFSEAINLGFKKPILKVNDRVVMLCDVRTGYETGTVKWLGILPTVGEEWMAGVDFENSVGSGTGKYKSKDGRTYKLFSAKRGHALFVPVIGLLKKEDVDLGGGSPEPTAPTASCIICMSNEAMNACIPCCHVVFCDSCAQLSRAASMSRCPVCRTRLEDLFRLTNKPK